MSLLCSHFFLWFEDGKDYCFHLSRTEPSDIILIRVETSTTVQDIVTHKKKRKSKCIGEGESWQIFVLLRNAHLTTEWKNLRVEISIILPCFHVVLSFSLLIPYVQLVLCQFFVFSSLPFHLSYLFILLIGDELLGMDGARYLKLDDFKDQDDDFLSPKKTLRDFEGGMGTT